MVVPGEIIVSWTGIGLHPLRVKPIRLIVRMLACMTTGGPVEILVIEFPGSRFAGGILPELRRLVAERTITVVDALLVRREADGTTRLFEVADLDPSEEAAMLQEVGDAFEGLVSDDDVEELTSSLRPGDSAAVLVVEHTWAATFAGAVLASGGRLSASVRIPAAVVDEIRATVPELV
jgi:hypothetical protein